MARDVKGLTITESVAIVSGIVIGAGIFKTPSLVAQWCGNEMQVVGLWVAGGVISLLGALCYAELSSSYPSHGGDYFFLQKAYGSHLAFLFAWSRMTVIQTGSIAMLAFLIGDYATVVFPIGRFSSSVYAVFTVAVFTLVNMAGIRSGSLVQRIFFSVVLLGLLLVVLTGLLSPSAATTSTHSVLPGRALGKAMIFVLLTYGGWNEAAYLSAEVHNSRQNIIKVLLYSIALITFIYCIMNIALLRALGIDGVSASQAVAADLMQQAAGSGGVVFVSILIVIAAFSTINAAIITGARTGYAVGGDISLLGFLHKWNSIQGSPTRALLVQFVLVLFLIVAGTGTRNGFVLMVEYTAPVFWIFFFLTGISLFVLRHKDTSAHRYFRVPGYPLTPVVFCGTCLYMFHASIVHTGTGALAGLAIMALGIPVLLVSRMKKKEDRYDML